MPYPLLQLAIISRRFEVSALILSSSGLLRAVRYFETDVSGLHICSIFIGRPIPETSVSDHLSPRNNREDGRIQFNRSGSLR